MLENCVNAQERWGGVSEIIDHWIDERQKLIKAFMSITTAKLNGALKQDLDRFCSLLIDYLSTGHFEVYEHLLREGDEFNDGSVHSAQAILELIKPSTDAALDFNDDYKAFNEPTFAEIREFSKRLSLLGESLEDRFELEDKLISLLHDAHREQVAEI